jgi:Ran GTPase-activating protein (RanGAP) involved in mRNA processing and transport
MRTNVHDTSDQRGCHFSHIGHTGSVYGDQDAGGVNPDGEDEKEEQEDEEQEEAEEEQEEEKAEEGREEEGRQEAATRTSTWGA